MYIGWGQKHEPAGYMTLRAAKPFKEFDDEAIGLKETVDPTVLQEEEVRLAKEAKRLAAEAAGEGGEEGDEEDED